MRVRAWVLMAVLAGAAGWWISDAANAPVEPVLAEATQRQTPLATGTASAPAVVVLHVAQPVAASQPAGAQVPWRPVPVEIGSEGFAPMVREALDNGSPQAAAAAAWQLKKCRDMDAQIESLHRFGATPKAAEHNDIYKGMVEDAQREQRRCQTITPDLDALRPALLLKAMRGGIEGAALDLFQETQEKPEANVAARHEVLAGVRGDAEGGNPYAMSTMSYEAQGLPGVERRAYKRASQLIEAGNAQHQGFLDDLAAKLGQMGLKLGDFDVFRKEPAAPDIDARVQALLAAHQAWLARRAAATGG